MRWRGKKGGLATNGECHSQDALREDHLKKMGAKNDFNEEPTVRKGKSNFSVLFRRANHSERYSQILESQRLIASGSKQAAQQGPDELDVWTALKSNLMVCKRRELPRLWGDGAPAQCKIKGKKTVG